MRLKRVGEKLKRGLVGLTAVALFSTSGFGIPPSEVEWFPSNRTNLTARVSNLEMEFGWQSFTPFTLISGSRTSNMAFGLYFGGSVPFEAESKPRAVVGWDLREYDSMDEFDWVNYLDYKLFFNMQPLEYKICRFSFGSTYKLPNSNTLDFHLIAFAKDIPLLKSNTEVLNPEENRFGFTLSFGNENPSYVGLDWVALDNGHKHYFALNFGKQLGNKSVSVELPITPVSDLTERVK
ncbi:hypothetical protein KY318_02765, partial [Candidatus Woesearchaeota archaeon]|nr:hypothetical protein [Candidatus Woesearchaeota archaeon]